MSDLAIMYGTNITVFKKRQMACGRDPCTKGGGTLCRPPFFINKPGSVTRRGAFSAAVARIGRACSLPSGMGLAACLLESTRRLSTPFLSDGPRFFETCFIDYREGAFTSIALQAFSFNALY